MPFQLITHIFLSQGLSKQLFSNQEKMKNCGPGRRHLKAAGRATAELSKARLWRGHPEGCRAERQGGREPVPSIHATISVPLLHIWLFTSRSSRCCGNISSCTKQKSELRRNTSRQENNSHHPGNQTQCPLTLRPLFQSTWASRHSWTAFKVLT